MNDCKVNMACDARAADQAAGQANLGGIANSKGYGPRVMTAQDEARKLLEADAAHRSLAADQALLLTMVMPFFDRSLDQLQQGIYRWNQHQGFWGGAGLLTHDEVRMKKAEKVALMHSELSEMLEAIRNDVPRGDKGCEEEEAADLLIRLLDYCGGFNLDLGGAFHRKQLKNLQRPFKHGKQF